VIVNNSAFIDNSIIGWKSQIGKWSRIENHCILGEEVNIHAEISINNTIALPNISVKTNVKDHIMLY